MVLLVLLMPMLALVAPLLLAGLCFDYLLVACCVVIVVTKWLMILINE
jgi:hypothetical protein